MNSHTISSVLSVSICWLDVNNAIVKQFQMDTDHSENCKHFMVNKWYHKEDGPAIIYKNIDHDGVYMDRELYYIRGERHRENAPASIETHHDKDNTTEWVYYRQGKIHRDDGPALIQFKNINNIKQRVLEMYITNDKLHRDDGPAVIHYIMINNKMYIHHTKFYKNNKLVNDSPSCIIYGMINGKMLKIYESFTCGKNQKYHRTNGPARIWYKYADGKRFIDDANYFYNGFYMTNMNMRAQTLSQHYAKYGER